MFSVNCSYNDTDELLNKIHFPVSSTNEVAIIHYEDTTWEAEWYNGSSWIRVGIEDVGFSSAGVVYNSGEIAQNTGILTFKQTLFHDETAKV